MIVEPRGAKKDKPKTTSVTVNQYSKSSSDLKKALKRLTNEYKRAQRSFKQNKISRQELFDFEWRIFEIQEEIKRLEDGIEPEE
jgi:hypothetical protein